MLFQDNNREKIMILGGNMAQIPLINASHKEGYYVVICDNTTTNPGLALADKHYQIDFKDKEKVLRIAQKEKVRGIISNSEAAMTIVAYVCEKMNLVGNTEKSVKILNSKEEFRNLQESIGLFTPKHFLTHSFNEACENAEKLSFPIIMKPCRSSGSRGTHIFTYLQEMVRSEEQWDKCSFFSMDNNVVIEEYVDMPDIDKVIDGDVFIHKGEIIWQGLFTSKRSKMEPNLPMTQTFPIILDEKEKTEVKDTICALFSGAGIVFGEFNIELYFGQDHKLFCIEINARQGGNGIPTMIERHCGINMYKLLVTTVMGHNDYFSEVISSSHECHYVSRHPVYSHKAGKYIDLYISEEIKPYIIHIQKNDLEGSVITRGIVASDKLAMIDLEFPDRKTQIKIVDDIEEYIYPIVISEE